MDIQQFEDRKRGHIRHALNPNNQAQGHSGLAQIRLEHQALPELDFEEVRLDTLCLGQRLQTPFFVAGMTAGHSDAAPLNHRLAAACQRRGWAMGVGSQRRQLQGFLERDRTGPTARASPFEDELDEWTALRELAPELVLFANVGISQVIRRPIEPLKRLVESIRAQGLAIHLNALQECIQPEGTPNFNGALGAIRDVVEHLGAPVILKETGCGFSLFALQALIDMGLAAVDASGLGGTHWGRIEGARAAEGGEDVEMHARAAATFADWGIPTAESTLNAGQVLAGSSARTEVWASGGVRTGLDAAKLIALGAHRVGYAQPALAAAIEGEKALDRWMAQQEHELRVALFCTGNARPGQLRMKEGAWKKIES